MIRRLVLIALSLAVLGGCATYDRGYRYAAPSQAGYGDYYYDPAPAPRYLAPAYAQYPAYYSLYYGFDHRYYSSWRRPGFHYGVTWFPNDWFAFSVVNRYPIGFRSGYGYYGHPYSPYRFSYFDHHYYARHHRQARHRDHYRPRYGHPSNERHIDRERIRRIAAGREDPRERNDRRVRNDPRDRLDQQGPGGYADRDLMRQRARDAGSRSVGPGATALQPGAGQGRMREAATQASRMRSAGPTGTPTPASTRPWQQRPGTPDATRVPAREAARSANLRPGMQRVEPTGDRGYIGAAREAAVLERRGAAARIDQAPRRIDRTGQAPAPMNRGPARQQMQRPPQAPRVAAPPAGRVPARQAVPQRAPAAAVPRSAPVQRQPAAAPAAGPRAAPARAAARRSARPPAEQEQ